jgi:hypothetical protein
MTQIREQPIIITSRTHELRCVLERFTAASRDLLDQFNREMTKLQDSAAHEIAVAVADEPELDIAEE